MEKNDIGIGLIIMTAITIIVGAILFQTIAQQSSLSTDKVTLSNATITAPALGNLYVWTDYKQFEGFTAVNATSGATIAAGNYTLAYNQVVNGQLAVTMNVTGEYRATSWKVTATATPVTYISESSGRSMVPLIGIFFALGILVVALYPVLKNRDLIG